LPFCPKTRSVRISGAYDEDTNDNRSDRHYAGSNKA
jgi:hypothetical protein